MIKAGSPKLISVTKRQSIDGKIQDPYGLKSLDIARGHFGSMEPKDKNIRIFTVPMTIRIFLGHSSVWKHTSINNEKTVDKPRLCERLISKKSSPSTLDSTGNRSGSPG